MLSALCWGVEPTPSYIRVKAKRVVFNRNWLWMTLHRCFLDPDVGERLFTAVGGQWLSPVSPCSPMRTAHPIAFWPFFQLCDGEVRLLHTYTFIKSACDHVYKNQVRETNI